MFQTRVSAVLHTRLATLERMKAYGYPPKPQDRQLKWLDIPSSLYIHWKIKTLTSPDNGINMGMSQNHATSCSFKVVAYGGSSPKMYIYICNIIHVHICIYVCVCNMCVCVHHSVGLQCIRHIPICCKPHWPGHRDAAEWPEQIHQAKEDADADLGDPHKHPGIQGPWPILDSPVTCVMNCNNN